MASIASGNDSPPLLQAGCLPPAPAVERGVAAKLAASADGSMLIYTHGKNVVVRSLEDAGSSYVYQEHSSNTTAAQFSPNGHYVASADASGKLRVWAWTNPEHMLKKETSLMPKGITDLCWDSESKRIAVSGDGKIKAGCVAYDTGSDLGAKMSGHMKGALSIAYRPKRPFRIASVGEDMAVMFYEGPPFKWTSSDKRTHSSFINCVRYAPNGSLFSTVASDKKIAFFDGGTGEKKLEIPNAHLGSLYSCAWTQDSAQLLTSSADKTVKLWDVETSTCIKTFTFADAPGLEHMQNSCTVAGDKFISLALSGDLSFLDPKSSSDRPVRVIQGHKGVVNSLAYDRASNRFATAGSTGAVCVWNEGGEGTASRVTGNIHTKNCCAVAISGDKLYSGAFDDKIKICNVSTGEYTSEIPLGGQPIRNGISVCQKDNSLVVCAKRNQLMLIRNGSVVGEKDLPGSLEATSVAIAANGSEIMMGGSDKNVHRFPVNGDVIENSTVLGNASGVVRVLAYSPDGAKLAMGTDDREVKVWDFASSKYMVSGYWKYHTAKITCIAWHPNSTNLASGGTDSSVFVWDIAKKFKKSKYPRVHANGDVQGVAWLNENTLLTTGMDSVTRQFPVTMP
eukprot:g1063.t1